jgi:hypothetical protein
VSRVAFDQVQTAPCGFCDVGPTADELAAEIAQNALSRVGFVHESGYRVQASRLAHEVAGMLSAALVIARGRETIDALYDVRDAVLGAASAASVAESSADFHAGFDAGYRAGRPGVVGTDRRAA